MEAVAYLVSAIGSSVGGSIGAFATEIATAVVAVGTVAAGEHQRQKAKSKALAAYNASLEDRLVMTSTVQRARSRCYGRVRNVDGVIFKATRGEHSDIYTLVIALAGHEIDGVETVYFGDTAVSLDADGWVQTNPYNVSDKTSRSGTAVVAGDGSASISIGAGVYVAGSATATQQGQGDTFTRWRQLPVSLVGTNLVATTGDSGATVSFAWQTTAAVSNARVRAYNGAAGQDMSSVLQPLFPDLIDSGDHRFSGIACLLVELYFSQDSYPSGVPSISAVIRGAKVLDPRTGNTAWSENPALIARDWALYANGGACIASDLNAASFTSAANDCDTSQVFTTAAGSVTKALYSAGIVCDTESDPWGQFQEIVEAMAGKAGWAGGTLRITAGVYRAPVAHITEGWLSGADKIAIVPEPPIEEAVNIYRPTFADAAAHYVLVPGSELRAAAYITADGRELMREITLGAVTDAVRVQHICGVLMRDARSGLSAILPCNLRAYKLELFDVVYVTLPRFGWESKTFEVVAWQFSLGGGVTVTLKETAASIYQADAVFSLADATPNTSLPRPWDVSEVTDLSVNMQVASLDDGQQIIRAMAQWAEHAEAGVRNSGYIELQYILLGVRDVQTSWVNASSAPVTWNNAGAGEVAWNVLREVDPELDSWESVTVSGAQNSAVITGLRASGQYLFRSRAVNTIGARSEWSIHALGQAPALQAA